MRNQVLTRINTIGVFALIVSLAACEGYPNGVPYRELGRDMAGIYNPAPPAASLDVRIVLGTRHTVSGRYSTGSGDVVFYGTWERRNNTLVVSIDPAPGMPSTIDFDITREKILTEIPRSPFSMTPETAPPQFIEQDIMRLRADALIAGTSVDLNLIRVITDVVGAGGGGLGQASVSPRSR